MHRVIGSPTRLEASIDYNVHKLIVQKRSIPLPVATGAVANL